jgi:aspartyl-tRNA(Asn)/glutamyl-tRNA(Gln) amidotransferase subunit A
VNPPTEELVTLPVSVLAERIESRQLSPVELVQAYLRSIERRDAELGAALITVCDRRAVRAARRAEARIARGDYRGPLDGIPFTVKDMFLTKGVRTTAGSSVLADWVPAVDAVAVERIAAAGGILIGKAHTTEFAVWATGGSPLYRAPRNPWNLEHTPGGSSGGSAVSVAAGFCGLSLGTDTGGSVRIPAAFCGLVGVKPTYGLVSTGGVIPTSWSHDHVGVLARTAVDAGIAVKVLSTRESRSVAALGKADGNSRRRKRRDLKGTRIGVYREMFNGVHDDVRRLCERSCAGLEDLGATIVEVDIELYHYAAPVAFIIQFTEMSAYHTPSLRTHMNEYGADVRKGLAMGQVFLGVQYVQARRVGEMLRREVEQSLAKADALVCPTTVVAAPRIDDVTVTVGDVKQNVNSILGQLTRLFNITGNPAVTVPCGLTPEGLPVGLQFAGRHWEDQALLELAGTFEQWHTSTSQAS